MQAYADRQFKNNNVLRTKDYIYLQPTDTVQRGHECMDLMTSELIHCPKAELCVMTKLVISRARVEELAASQECRMLKFFNRKK